MHQPIKVSFLTNGPFFFEILLKWVILCEDYENEHEKFEKMLFHRFFVD
jgi:hypothetical protein